jgi:hypothetical protein
MMSSIGKMLQRLFIIVCVSFLCATSAAADAATSVSSVFPAADMSLKLAFDLASPALLAPSINEQCFIFFPNAQFQGLLLLFIQCEISSFFN